LTASAQQRFVAALSGAQEVPANGSAAKGTCSIVLNAAQTQITVNCTFSGLGSNLIDAHIHGNAAVGVNAPPLFGFTGLPSATSGTIGPLNFAVTPAQVTDMRRHLHYVNLHSVNLPGGEIRGQIKQAQTVFDHDGDGRTDVTIFRPSTDSFWVLNSLNGNFTQLTHGTSGDSWLNLTADFDGDGRGDPLVLRVTASIFNWIIYETSTNTVRNVSWGNASLMDTLAMSDYDGDGKQDIAIFRRTTGDWWYIESSTGAIRFEHWGTTNDFPSIGDYDGDGKADLTAVRVEGGQRIWYIRNSSTGSMRREPWGSSATDGLFFFAPFDVDGDGRQDLMVNRTTAGQRVFHVLRSSDGQYIVLGWGLTSDAPLFGDYDGDGKTDLVARRDVGGNLFWFILRSSDGQLQLTKWGLAGDQRVGDPDIVNGYKSFVQSE
jgi:hypothetical protein